MLSNLVDPCHLLSIGLVPVLQHLLICEDGSLKTRRHRRGRFVLEKLALCRREVGELGF